MVVIKLIKTNFEGDVLINFLNLKYFMLTAQQKNITRVAESEHVSQQSLSNQIKKIEDIFGTKLFDRTGGLTLTHAGEILYKYAERLLALKDEMDREMADLKGSKQGVLRIGISYTRGSAFLPEILPLYKKENPFVKISVVENNSRVLEEYLMRGHIDLYIGSELKKASDTEIINLCSERLYMVVPKVIANKFYNEVTTVFDTPEKAEKFKDFDFLMLTRDNRVRRIADEHLKKIKDGINILIETENIETLFSLACKGMGITFYPEMFMKKHENIINSTDCPVCFIPLEGKYSHNQLSVGYSKRKYLSHAAKKFIDCAKEVYNQ